MPQVRAAQVLRFGVFEVNLPARELRKHGVRVRLPRQPYAILTMLLEKPGEIITREEMRARLWSSDTFVDFEHGLNSCIKRLRVALNDNPQNSRYIETVPRVGYRFIAPVEPTALTPLSIGAQRSDELASADEPNIQSRRPLFVLAMLLIVGLCASLAWSRFRNRPRPMSKTVDELHAVVNANTANDAGNHRAVSSKSAAEARDLFLKGMYFWNKRTIAGFREAIDYFQQATAKDPNNAPAYAGLANAYTLLTAYSGTSSTLYIPQARAAALRAIQIDQRSAEGHTSLALILQNHDWDWQGSEREFRRAIELNPNYATAHHWYAEHLMWLGRFDEALRESDRARELDPLSVIIATDHGAILFYSRRYDLAINYLQALLEKAPDFPRAAHLLIQAYVEKGMYKQAVKEMKTQATSYGDGPSYWQLSGYVYGRAGEVKLARRELEKLEKRDQKEQLSPESIIRVYLAVGNKEEALSDLEKAYAGHYNNLTALKVDPVFDPLRSDPRYQDLMGRVGLGDANAK
jgi:DNA-binding winged helix-turn-helix (wHTH) protein/Flp pilus assembly protein TadD